MSRMSQDVPGCPMGRPEDHGAFPTPNLRARYSCGLWMWICWALRNLWINVARRASQATLGRAKQLLGDDMDDH